MATLAIDCVGVKLAAAGLADMQQIPCALCVELIDFLGPPRSGDKGQMCRTPTRALREGGIAETANGGRALRSGYPVLPGALESGSDTFDPYRRSGAAQEVNGSGAGSAGNLLHVCQTCGQLTAPDAVYCQSCHHSIAHECVNCRLSLLPIQDRCPRCHTPNEFSVRRAHPGR